MPRASRDAIAVHLERRKRTQVVETRPAFAGPSLSHLLPKKSHASLAARLALAWSDQPTLAAGALRGWALPHPTWMVDILALGVREWAASSGHLYPTPLLAPILRSALLMY